MNCEANPKPVEKSLKNGFGVCVSEVDPTEREGSLGFVINGSF